MKEYNLKFKINDTVYVKTDREQAEWKVKQILITTAGVFYQVRRLEAIIKWCRDFELSTERWHLKKIATND